MKPWLLIFMLFLPTASCYAGSVVQTPYTPQKVVYEFYFNEPSDINNALFWIRSLVNPLSESPYDLMPEDLDIKVVVHGTEIVTLAKKNYAKYKTAVDRMRYYSSVGVEFKVCALASRDFGYKAKDYQDFVQVVPSAFNELTHWQMQGYALIRPVVLEKKYSRDEIR
jgi:intracellular sulfur oxidation DsrE/DsrF family protein